MATKSTSAQVKNGHGECVIADNLITRFITRMFEQGLSYSAFQCQVSMTQTTYAMKLSVDNIKSLTKSH